MGQASGKPAPAPLCTPGARLGRQAPQPGPQRPSPPQTDIKANSAPHPAARGLPVGTLQLRPHGEASACRAGTASPSAMPSFTVTQRGLPLQANISQQLLLGRETLPFSGNQAKASLRRGKWNPYFVFLLKEPHQCSENTNYLLCTWRFDIKMPDYCSWGPHLSVGRQSSAPLPSGGCGCESAGAAGSQLPSAQGSEWSGARARPAVPLRKAVATPTASDTNPLDGRTARHLPAQRAEARASWPACRFHRGSGTVAAWPRAERSLGRDEAGETPHLLCARPGSDCSVCVKAINPPSYPLRCSVTPFHRQGS